MKLLWIPVLVFLYSCSSSTNFTSGKSSKTNELKPITSADLEERKEDIKSEISTAQILKLESNSVVIIEKSDPFFDHITGNEQVKITRPAKAETEYEMIDVWSVQIASLIDEVNADRLKMELETKFDFPVRKSFESDIYKIRIGSYAHRNDADQLVFDIKREGYPAAWVTKDKIKKVKTDKVQSTILEGKFFYLQLGNFSSELYAKQFEKELKSKTNKITYIKRLNGFYKILIGKVKNKSELDSIRSELQSLNYQSFVIEL